MSDKDLDHKLRLSQFFKSNPEIWEDIEEELNICLDNTLNQLQSINCEKREFYAGYCNGIKDVLVIKDHFKGWVEPE